MSEKITITILGPQGAHKTSLARAIKKQVQNFASCHDTIVEVSTGQNSTYAEAEYECVPGKKRK